MNQKLLIVAVICTAVSVYADVPKAGDVQACTDLCTKCQGTAAFADGLCECYIDDRNVEGNECLVKIKKEADDMGMSFMGYEAARGDRPPRCTIGCGKYLKTYDVDRISKYFVNKGPVVDAQVLIPTPCATGGVVAGQVQSQAQSQAQAQSQSQILGRNLGILGGGIPMDTSAYYQVPSGLLGAALPQYSLHSNLRSALPSIQLPTLRFAHNDLYAPVHTSAVPLVKSRLSGILGIPHIGEVKDSIARTALPLTVSTTQNLKDRPQLWASTGQLDLNARLEGGVDLVQLFYNTLIQQSQLLELLHQHLPSLEGLYLSGELKTACRNNNECSKVQVPMVAAPKLNLHCNQGINNPRPPRMSESIQKESATIEKISKNEEPQAIEMTERPRRESRQNSNGRNRKRELKKNLDKLTASP